MAEMALCRYACPNCGTELESEGILLLDAAQPADSTYIQQLLEGTLNVVACKVCGQATLLPLPFFYHDAAQQMLVGYVPGAGSMSQAELADALNAPMSAILGALLPDEEKTRLDEYQRHILDVPADVEMIPVNAEAERAQAEADAQANSESTPLQLNVPQYMVQPTLVDNLEIIKAMLVAVRDGMTADEMMSDLQRLQFLNALIAENDPIAKRRVMKHNENLLDDQIYLVIDTIREQAVEQDNAPVVEHLARARADIERYQQSMAKRDAAVAAAFAKRAERQNAESE